MCQNDYASLSGFIFLFLYLFNTPPPFFFLRCWPVKDPEGEGEGGSAVALLT